MPVVNLTNEFLKSLSVIPGARRTEWCDRTLKGLYIEMRATSPHKGTYYLRYKDKGGTTRHMRLGDTQTISLAEARKLAKGQKAKLQLGLLRSTTKGASKDSILLKDFIEHHYVPYAKATKRSWKSDVQRFNQKILEKFGDRPMTSITKKEVIDFHLSLKAENLSGATCDHFLKLLKRCYSLAHEWEFIGTNTLQGIKCFNEPNFQNDVLSDEEFAKLVKVLHSHPNKLLCRLVRFLLATGCRLSEALTMTYEDIQADNRLWLVPATNSKNKKILTKPLSPAAMEIISELSAGKDKPTGYLFVNPRTGDRLYSIHKGWNSIRKQAGLPNMKLKSARQHFASTLVSAGRSLLEVQTLLGHSSPAITAERYARLSVDRLHQAANVASDQLQSATPKLLPSPADTPDEAA